MFIQEWVQSKSDAGTAGTTSIFFEGMENVNVKCKNATREIKAMSSGSSRKMEIYDNIRDSIILNSSDSSCSYTDETNRKI
jgi:hypothetical protein